MLRYILFLFSFIAVSILSGCYSQKQPTVQDVSNTVIFSPVPTAKETTLVPVGYTTCYTVNAGFYQHMWVAAHRVCEYVNAVDKRKGIWVDGYWMCTRYDLGKGSKACQYWLWKKAHFSAAPLVY